MRPRTRVSAKGSIASSLHSALQKKERLRPHFPLDCFSDDQTGVGHIALAWDEATRSSAGIMASALSVSILSLLADAVARTRPPHAGGPAVLEG